jgi:hypothetical protein
VFPSLELAGGEDPEGMVRQEHSVHWTNHAIHICSSHRKGTVSRERKVFVVDKNLWRSLQNILWCSIKNGCTIRLAKYLLMENF